MSELFDAVDALIASRSALPPPVERRRLRQAHGLTLDEVAAALQVRRATVSGWEAGKTEPRPPERDAYARMLEQLARLYPADPNVAVPATDAVVPATPAVPAAPASSAAEPVRARPEPTSPTAEPANTALRPAGPVAVPRPAATTRPASSRPAAKKTVPAGTPAGGADQRFANGPLAVVDVDADGEVLAYCTGGLVLDVSAKSIPALVEWTLREGRLGQSKLSGPGKDADPLLVLTE
ncbi:helix-turn-helix domain-containing protein, partial [Streptomyces sp. NPDC059468]|uniref:helix-turn-helix domain-containing protein n=1 Tax=Streptomyces sp. NPDC059468 TaxID=3346845 RepID=UPI0036737B1A